MLKHKSQLLLIGIAYLNFIGLGLSGATFLLHEVAARRRLNDVSVSSLASGDGV